MYRQKIAHRTRGSICYHNFPNILLVYLLSSHFKKIFLHGSFRERAEIFTFCVENIRLFSLVC